VKKDKLPPWAAQLGKHPDYWFAVTYGVSAGFVCSLRLRLGIPGYRFGQADPWPKELLRLLGKVPDRHLAKRFRIDEKRVAAKRRQMGIAPLSKSVWTKKAIAQLGKVPDSEIAAALGLNIVSVAAKRRRLGIPALKTPRPRLTPKSYPAAMMSVLGKIPDYEVSSRFDIPVKELIMLRRRLGISGSRDGTKKRTRT